MLGETHCAFGGLAAGASYTEQDIVAYSKKYLASVVVPRAVVFGKLPNTSTGSIQKFQLHKQAAPAASIEM